MFLMSLHRGPWLRLESESLQQAAIHHEDVDGLRIPGLLPGNVTLVDTTKSFSKEPQPPKTGKYVRSRQSVV